MKYYKIKFSIIINHSKQLLTWCQCQHAAVSEQKFSQSVTQLDESMILITSLITTVFMFSFQSVQLFTLRET